MTVELDLNQTITSAVNARIEAQVLAAMSGDEVLGQMVASALNQPVKVTKDSFSRDTEPYVTHLLRQVIQDATHLAVTRLVAEERDMIEEEIRKALRRDVKRISESLTNSLVDAADRGYGIKVDLSLQMPDY